MGDELENPGPGKRATGGLLAFGVALAAVVAAIGYRTLDSGGDGDPERAEAGDPVESLEARIATDPTDVAALRELGFLRFDRGEYDEAAKAYRRAVGIETEDATLWSALGEALVMASTRDPMPPEALAAFRKAAAIDPGDPRARYFLAVRRDLAGDHRGAIADWLALLADTPPGAPWESDLARTIEQVAAINRIELGDRLAQAQTSRAATEPLPGREAFSVANGIPGPSAADLAAASSIPPGEQRQMAEGMVARLEAKLGTDPANVEGWIMLMRSRMTLDQPDLARQALANATAANPSAAARLRAQAEALGLR